MQQRSQQFGGHATYVPPEHVCREALLGDASRGPQARETARTAELDNAGLVQLQRDTMREQDESLERLEQSVMGTRVRGRHFERFRMHAVAVPGVLISGGDGGRVWGLRPASQDRCPTSCPLLVGSSQQSLVALSNRSAQLASGQPAAGSRGAAQLLGSCCGACHAPVRSLADTAVDATRAARGDRDSRGARIPERAAREL